MTSRSRDNSSKAWHGGDVDEHPPEMPPLNWSDDTSNGTRSSGNSGRKATARKTTGRKKATRRSR